MRRAERVIAARVRPPRPQNWVLPNADPKLIRFPRRKTPPTYAGPRLRRFLQSTSRSFDRSAWPRGGDGVDCWREVHSNWDLESSALLSLGLRRDHTLVDIGCGSGRLPYALRDYLEGNFVGTDLLDEPLEYAREKCGRADWRFIVNHLPTIPVDDSTGDFITFFSVFHAFARRRYFPVPDGGDAGRQTRRLNRVFLSGFMSANRIGPFLRQR